MVYVLFQTGVERICLIGLKLGECRTFLPLAIVPFVLRVFDGVQRNAGVFDVFLVCGGGGRRGLLRRIDTQS